MNNHSLHHFMESIKTDDDFIVQIHDEPAPFEEPDFIDPATLGEWDAQDGLLCVPEQYYADRIKCAQYAQGHASVAGPTLLSNYWLVASETPAIEDDYEFIKQGGA